MVSDAQTEHRGNRIYQENKSGIDRGTAFTFSASTNNGYLSGTSDIAALMILEHQTHLHTLISSLTIHTRRALYDQKILNKYMEDEDPASNAAAKRIKHAADNVLECMFFKNEAPLPELDLSRSVFSSEFMSRGPRDQQGRSLYDLQMNQRMLRYPFSYLVYSETFNDLPQEALDYIWPEIKVILDSPSRYPGYEHVSMRNKKAIREILFDTHPAAREYWKKELEP